MSEEFIKKDKLSEDIQYPDYIVQQPHSVRRVWEKWNKIVEKIDNHPNRFYTCILPSTQNVKTFDLKNVKALLLHHCKKLGVSQYDVDQIVKLKEEISKLQYEKLSLYRTWAREVFKGKKGDSSVLALKKEELIELFGSYHTLPEVCRKVTEWGFAIHSDKIKQFYLDNESKIKTKKAEYVTKKHDLKLSTDTGRLEVLVGIVNEHLKRFEKEKSLAISREIRAIIDQIRKEVKGEEIRLTFDGKIDINATLAANKAMNEVFSKLPINLVVIALTSAKVGINPIKMMGDLASSYYSKWNGFNKLESINTLELPGKFIKNYDWNEIQRIHERELENEVEEIEVEEVMGGYDHFDFKKNKSDLFDMLNDYKRTIVE